MRTVIKFRYYLTSPQSYLTNKKTPKKILLKSVNLLNNICNNIAYLKPFDYKAFKIMT